MEIKPSPYKLAVQFIESDDELDSDVELAIVIGVGSDVKAAKKSDTILVDKYAKEDGIKIDDSTYLIGEWSVLGTVKQTASTD